MTGTRVQQIIDAIVAGFVGLSTIKGAIDDVPWQYDKPPQPRPGNGDARVPLVGAGGYAWIFETGEIENGQPGNIGNDVELYRDLTVQTETAYRFEPVGANGMMPLGRSLLGDIQKMMAGLVGTMSAANLAFDSREGRWSVQQAPDADGLGIVISEWIVTYHRAKSDPTQP